MRMGKHIKTFAPEEPFTAMVIFRDRLIVATARRIYELIDDKLQPIDAKEVEYVPACHKCGKFDGMTWYQLPEEKEKTWWCMDCEKDSTSVPIKP
jgi:hypothetical protein